MFRTVCVSTLAAFSLLAVSMSPALAEHHERPAAAPEDVESVDAVMAAIYDVISGPAGEPRDWDRFLSLFHPDAKLIPVEQNGATFISPEGYVERGTASFAENGFFEYEIGRKTERFGDIAHAFSAYAAKRNADDAEPFMRGINSFQLLHHNDRWWIVNIYWQAETEDNPVPEEYLSME